MHRPCAYCGETAGLTREHVVPKFIYANNPLGKFGYNPRADAFVTWEAQIRDVCARCNNERLSVLDSYLKTFYEDNHIDKLVTEEKTIRLRYDYHLLCRALLKLTYNGIRFRGGDILLVKPFCDYILYGVDLPGHLAVKISAEVIPCHRITDHERTLLEGEAMTWSYIPPHVIRLGQMGGTAAEHLFVRYVFVKNYCFYVVIFQRSMQSQTLHKCFASFTDALPDTVFLDVAKKAVTLRVSGIDALDKYSDTALSLAEKWAAYVGKKG